MSGKRRFNRLHGCSNNNLFPSFSLTGAVFFHLETSHAPIFPSLAFTAAAAAAASGGGLVTGGFCQNAMPAHLTRFRPLHHDRGVGELAAVSFSLHGMQQRCVDHSQSRLSALVVWRRFARTRRNMESSDTRALLSIDTSLVAALRRLKRG